MTKKRILTGDRPTGSLHLGHYVGSLRNRVRFQEEYDCFFIIADYQVFTDHLNDNIQISKNIREITMDYLSVGIDPKKSSIFIQSEIPEIAQLTMYFSFLVSIARLNRNPTIKEELKAAKIKESEMSYGFLGYPVSQAADILALRANIVPVGEDQLPHLEQTREIAKKFNNVFKADLFELPEALLGEVPRLSGLDGQKMSKSRNNAIYLKDSKEDVAKKVMKVFTDPTRIHADDPGHIEGNVLFEYFDAFSKDKEEVSEFKKEYKKGKIGDVLLKKRLGEVINEFLEPIREKRKEYESHPMLVEKILEEGIEKTRKEAGKTMEMVKEAIYK